jgi:hypothetical protein
LSSGNSPSGLELNLASCRISNTGAAIPWIAFHHGLKPSHPLLKKIPEMIAQHIFSFLVPRAEGENLGLFFKQVKHKALPGRLTAVTTVQSTSLLPSAFFTPSPLAFSSQ